MQLASGLTVKALAAALSLVGLIVGATYWTLTVFQTRAAAAVEHRVLAEYDELGYLETQLEVIRLEIKLLNRAAERDGALSADDAEQLDALREKREIFQRRRAELLAARRG